MTATTAWTAAAAKSATDASRGSNRPIAAPTRATKRTRTYRRFPFSTSIMPTARFTQMRPRPAMRAMPIAARCIPVAARVLTYS
jgi:hypothetical protein